MIHDRDRAPGSQVAFTTARRQVMAVDIDSPEPRALTTGRTFKLSVAWSPDGERLAFESIRWRFEGNIRIGVVDSDGGHQRFLTSARSYSTTPSWSPEGEQIVYACERFSGNFGDICVMDADGQAILKVLDLESGEVTRIAGDRDNQAAPLDWQPRP